MHLILASLGFPPLVTPQPLHQSPVPRAAHSERSPDLGVHPRLYWNDGCTPLLEQWVYTEDRMAEVHEAESPYRLISEYQTIGDGQGGSREDTICYGRGIEI
jgi:hypothetical protein